MTTKAYPDMLLRLGYLLDAGIVERRWELPDRSDWGLTHVGPRGLEIGFAVKVGTDGNQVSHIHRAP